MPNITTIEKNDKNETDAEKLNLRRIIAGAEIYYNFTGKEKCLNLKDPDQLGTDMWDYQVMSNTLSTIVVKFHIYLYCTITHYSNLNNYTFFTTHYCTSVLYRNGYADVF